MLKLRSLALAGLASLAFASTACQSDTARDVALYRLCLAYPDSPLCQEPPAEAPAQ